MTDILFRVIPTTQEDWTADLMDRKSLVTRTDATK